MKSLLENVKIPNYILEKEAHYYERKTETPDFNSKELVMVVKKELKDGRTVVFVLTGKDAGKVFEAKDYLKDKRYSLFGSGIANDAFSGKKINVTKVNKLFEKYNQKAKREAEKHYQNCWKEIDDALNM